METVLNNLTGIVVKTTEPVDQNVDNIEIISSIVFETASLLNQSSAEGNIEPAVIEMVSCHALSSSSFQIRFLGFVFLHTLILHL